MAKALGSWIGEPSNRWMRGVSHMQFTKEIPTAFALAAAMLVAAILASPSAAKTTLRSPICTRGLTTVERDPRALLPLTGESVAGAASAALHLEKSNALPWVTRAALATIDTERGPEAKVECGTRVWNRTVVVYITLRAFGNNASLAERVDFVGRFKDGYHVWQIVH
jgi:predicted ATPase